MPISKSDNRPRARDPWPGVREESASLYVSIVCAVDGARFAAVGASEQDCVVQVASYVAEQASGQLSPASARRVNEYLAAGDKATAVAEYFRHAGERWEAEWLVTTPLIQDSLSTAWSGNVPLPKRVAVPHAPQPPG
jgi:hypothetical protein